MIRSFKCKDKEFLVDTETEEIIINGLKVGSEYSIGYVNNPGDEPSVMGVISHKDKLLYALSGKSFPYTTDADIKL